MECPFCESERVIVTRTISNKNNIVRYRKCKTCNKDFTTIEVFKEILEEYIDKLITSDDEQLCGHFKKVS